MIEVELKIGPGEYKIITLSYDDLADMAIKKARDQFYCAYDNLRIFSITQKGDS